MTKEVMVTITGRQTMDGEAQEPIEMVHVGEYYEKNGTHYILFDEVVEGFSGSVKNIIKIRDRYLEVQKRGVIGSNMVFEEGKRQETTYSVPYGSFLMETATSSVQLRQTEELLEAVAAYEMSLNGARCADCDIRVAVVPRESFQLSRGNDR